MSYGLPMPATDQAHTLDRSQGGGGIGEAWPERREMFNESHRRD